jgi:lipopolysaccharide export system protein LptA
MKLYNKKRVLSYVGMSIFSLFIILLWATPLSVHFSSQKPPTDTVIVKHADRMSIKKLNDSTTVTILVGNVDLKQGKTIFKCDSCVKNDKDHIFEAWRNVHIIDADTTNIYAGHLRYLTDKQKAFLDGSVKLTDGHAVLTTPSLEYDMTIKIATYKNGGKIVNKKTVITSKEASYYTDPKDVYFTKNVFVDDPSYRITTDSLLYNTGNQISRFIAPTVIRDSANRIIHTRDGFYNLKTGDAQFAQRPTINDNNKSNIKADSLILNKDFATAIGNAVIIDSTRKTIIIGNLVIQNRNTEAVLATQKPLMIVKQENDSIYIAADTLFSAKLTDLGKHTSLISFTDSVINKDTVLQKKYGSKAKKDNDSTNRYFEAYHHVKIFTDSAQAVSDSLFYSFKDSVFRLYQDPVIWSKDGQITGDTLYLHTRNKKPLWFEAINKAFMVNHLEKEAFNQIKSTRIDGRFTDGNLDSVRAKGSAECIYYLQDEDSAYSGINQSTSDVIDAYIREKKLKKVVFRGNVEGTIYPIKQKKPDEMRLQNFRWLENRRPKTKYDLMQ